MNWVSRGITFPADINDSEASWEEGACVAGKKRKQHHYVYHGDNSSQNLMIRQLHYSILSLTNQLIMYSIM